MLTRTFTLKSCVESHATKHGDASFYRYHSDFVPLGLSDWIKARCLSRLEEGISAPAPYLIQEGTFGMLGRGLIIDEDQILQESVQNINLRCLPQWVTDVTPYSIEISSALLEKPGKYTQKAFILDSVWNGNYGHWMLESMTRLYIATESKIDILNTTFFVGEYPAHMHGLWQEAINLVTGIEAPLQLNSPELIHFSNSTWISPVTIHPWHYHTKCIEMGGHLSDLVRARSHNIYSRAKKDSRRLVVFYSRRHDSSRSLSNEAEIIEFFRASCDVYVIDKPQDLALSQRIALAQSADLIAGITGAAMADIIFAKHGIPVISISPSNMPHDVYWQLASMKTMRYIAVGGALDEIDIASNESWRRSFSVSLDLISQALEAAFS